MFGLPTSSTFKSILAYSIIALLFLMAGHFAPEAFIWTATGLLSVSIIGSIAGWGYMKKKETTMSLFGVLNNVGALNSSDVISNNTSQVDLANAMNPPPPSS